MPEFDTDGNVKPASSDSEGAMAINS
jgi:hypothetical protein